MAAEKSPAFQFYVRDWRSSRRVQVMSFALRGMYLEMLIEQWDKGAAPASAEACALSLGGSTGEWTRAWSALSACFTPRKRDGLLVNAKLEAVRRSKLQFVKSQQKKALTKWHPEAAAPVAAKMTRGQRLSAAKKHGSHTSEEWEEMQTIYGRCLRCGERRENLAGGNCVKDHIVPLYQGGDDSIRNIQPMCRNCNSSKGSDATDHRIGLSETRPEWLPNACRTSTDASSSSSSASATASSSALASATAKKKEEPATLKEAILLKVADEENRSRRAFR